MLSDVHLGKISHFRKHGAAVPQAAIYRNFDLLDTAIAQTAPDSLIFLGDLFHSAFNTEWDVFEAWRRRTPLPMTLVAGNHDIIPKERFNDLNIRVVAELTLDGFLLTHTPTERPGLFNLCGHIHPGVVISGTGRQRISLPCFFQRPDRMILPAFGTFTGTHNIKPKRGDRAFVLVDGEVVAV